MYLQLVSLLSAIQLSAALAKIHSVYWNSTNPIFRIDNTDHIVDVNEANLPWEYDQLNIICPQNSLEQHVIYSVSQDEFESCRVTNPRPKIVAICNKPEEFQYFTITFRNFSPTPGGLEFRPGENYYLISTSTRRDLHRRVGGFCSSHNMKMIFKVAEREETVNSPLYSAVMRTTTRRPPSTTTSPLSTSRKVPVYYYKSRTPSVTTSDYIYYYSPRDLIQLKLAAKRHGARQINSENSETFQAAPLTASSSRALLSSALVLLTSLLTSLAGLALL